LAAPASELAVGIQVVVKHLGSRAGDTRGGVDENIPPLSNDREYVLIVSKSSAGTLWLAYGGEGVFERANGLVNTAGRSALANHYRGVPWTTLLRDLREPAATIR